MVNGLFLTRDDAIITKKTANVETSQLSDCGGEGETCGTVINSAHIPHDIEINKISLNINQANIDDPTYIYVLLSNNGNVTRVGLSDVGMTWKDAGLVSWTFKNNPFTIPSGASVYLYFTNDPSSATALSVPSSIKHLSVRYRDLGGAGSMRYYDRWYDNLIENCIAGAMLSTGIYYYFPMAYQTDTKDQLIRDLYNLMGTNTEHPGTSKAQYNNGLTTYVRNQGYNISFTNCETNGTFNFETYKNMITQGKPVALFLIGYNLTEIGLNDEENFISFSKNEYVTNHVVVGYGYEIYKFYDENNNLISEKIALAVSCGLEIGNCYYILNNNGTLEDAEAVYIY